MPAEVRAKCLNEITDADNRCFALAAGDTLAATLPPEKQELLAHVIGTASAEKLVTFRQQVEAGQLSWSAIESLK